MPAVNARALAAAFAVGAAAWLLGVSVGPGPSALAAGKWYLVILFAAGLAVGAVERGLTWTGLAGLFAGQVAALLAHAALEEAMRPDLAWQPFFILSVTLAGAVGAAVAGLARGGAGGGDQGSGRTPPTGSPLS
jgi:hypothetical protein